MCRTFELYVWPPSWFFPLWATQRQQQHEIFFNAGCCCCCCWRGLRSLFTPSHFGFGRLRLFFVLCLFKTTTTTKSVQFPLCTFHTQKESERERRRTLIDFGASFVVCARRSLCSFSSARHIFLFPLCATLLPLRCLPVYVCECEWICVCIYVLYRHVYIFIFHIFGLFLPCTHTHRQTHGRLLCFVAFIIFHFFACVCV